MKTRFVLSLVLFAAPISLCLGAPPGAELRGVWMHATQVKTPAEADAMLARIERANLNAAFILVWYWGGQAFFRSDLCPMGDGVPAGFDPLGYLVEQGHKRGIQVHAWFVNGSYGSSTIRHVLDQHPDWAVDDGGAGGLWYDFGKPEVRRFQSDLMLECLRKYDIDGLHFDYIRYGPRQCYCTYCQREFARRYGFEPMTAQSRATFPVFVSITGNPLVKPTTAVVLAEFSDGTPAIALNRLGAGTALLLNWHAEEEMPPAVAELVKLTLGIWTTTGAQVHITTTAANRQEYGAGSLNAARACLTRLGYAPKLVAAEQIAKLPAHSVLVLPAVYVIPADTRAALEQFVTRGGRLLLIDGPVKAMPYAAMQRLTGFAGTGRYRKREDVIQSTGRSPLVQRGKHHIDLAQWKQRMEKWSEFRKAGVTDLVRDVSHRAKALKPNAQVTAAVFNSLESAGSASQDWPRWLREKTLDYVVPMAYTENPAELARQIAQWKTVDPTLTRIVPGLALYHEADGKTTPRDLNLIRSQVRLCRQHGTHGTMFFSLPYLTDPLIDLLRTDLFLTTPPPCPPPLRRVP